jgi:hypothetical protein
MYTATMINLEIPDPFTAFVAEKYSKTKGLRYDFFSSEWDMECGACSEPLNAPTKKIMTKIRLYHTRNECMGGY